MNTTLALLPVILSYGITIGVLYVLYTKFFIKYMNLKGDGKDKIISYSLLIGLLTFGLGLTSVLNELFFVQFNNSTIQSKNIEQGIFTLLFYPLVFWSLGFILHKVFKKQPRGVQLSEGSGFKLNKNTYLIISGVVVLVFMLSIFTENEKYPTSSPVTTKTKGEKEFQVQSCNYCDKLKNECKDTKTIKTMIVDLQKVLFILENDSIMDTSRMSTDMKCSIIPSKNFMFDCSSMTYSNNVVGGTTYKYDGKNNLTSETFYEINSRITSNNLLTCKVR